MSDRKGQSARPREVCAGCGELRPTFAFVVTTWGKKTRGPYCKRCWWKDG